MTPDNFDRPPEEVYNKNISKSMRRFPKMTESTQKRQVRRGRIFPGHQSSPETRARRIAEREECRDQFWKLGST